MRFIYTLSIDNIVHYVGKTKDIKERSSAHKIKYPNSLFEVIDIVPILEWKFWERHYISLYRSWGFLLDNKKLHGGNGGDILSEEHKHKISQSLKKAHAEKKGGFGDPERLKKIGDGNRGKKMSDEAKAKLSIAGLGNTAHLGHKHSKESKARMSKIKIGKPVSDITRKKLSAGTGRKVSNEIKRHLSEINTGKTLSDEHKLKLSEARLGMKFSEEHRKKMSDASKGKSKKKHLINQLELDGTFVRAWTSLLELTENGYHRSNVTACCADKKKSAYGYRWTRNKHKDDED